MRACAEVCIYNGSSGRLRTERVDNDLANARHGLVPLNLRVPEVGVRRAHISLVVAGRHCTSLVSMLRLLYFLLTDRTLTVSGLRCLKENTLGVMYSLPRVHV